MKKSRSGFTIVELVVVIVVIAILATIVVVSYSGVQARTRDAERKTDVANIVKAMEIYYGDNGEYPWATTSTGSVINDGWYNSSDASWQILASKLESAKAIDRTPTDPINTPSNSSLYPNSYSYAIYVNQSTYCGVGVGQMYILVYRFEASKKELTSEGNCAAPAIGDSYYASGANYYRSVKGGI